jgi:hypothetical protein
MWQGAQKGLIVVFIVLTSSVFSGACWARSVSMKVACSNCHTMHNSENNAEIVAGGLGPQPALMSATCSTCHTESTGTPIDGTKPFVSSIVAPNYNSGAGGSHGTLAGGSFYWVATGSDLKGHNVAGVGATQVLGRYPPGGSDQFDTLTCAGATGCHGDPLIAGEVQSIWGSHHDVEISPLTGGAKGASYRFLTGIVGVEDSDWEFSLTAADHNQYKGVDRTADDDIGANLKTISHLCARCHGDFHSDKVAGDTGTAATSFASPWIRHPVDIDMCDAAVAGSEYLAYGGLGTNAYVVTTPLGDANTTATAVLDTVTLGGACIDDTAIITCITCHRAHGSPYDYSLRWNYQAWPGGTYAGGCPDCHSAKN